MPSYANQTVRLQQQSLPFFPAQSSFIQLFGDTFATNPANSLYLLGDTLSALGGSTLTNNNAVTFPSVQDLTINQDDVSEYDGVNQFLSLATESSVEVGLGSFVTSIWFKTNFSGSAQGVSQYGERSAGNFGWSIFFGGGGEIRFEIRDDIASAQIIDSIAGRFVDNNWHLATMVVDRTLAANLMYGFVDGELIGTQDISAVTNSLNSTVGLKLGARDDGVGAANFFTGQLANFSLYFPDITGVLPPDYNLPAILNAGIRESAVTGNSSLSNNTAGRINNLFALSTTIEDYATTTINTSEGIYDLLTLYRQNTTLATVSFEIDGNQIQTIDMSGADTQNVQNIQTGIYLSAGTHTLKLRNSTSGGFEISMIELIKREGNATDGDSASGVFFGDEITNQSGNYVLRTSPDNTYNNRIENTTVDADGDFWEVETSLKKGLYKWTVTHQSFSSYGIFEIFVGGVKVMTVDAFNAGLQTNQQFTTQAFIEGGLVTIRQQINGQNVSSTGFRSSIMSLRYELVTGRSEGDDVEIFYPDADFQTVSGNDQAITIDTAARFNGYQFVSTHATGDEYFYNRYFSGGTYKFKLVYANANLGGLWEVNINNGTPFLSFDSFNATTQYQQQEFATVTIPRGIQEVHFKNVGTSNTGFRLFNTRAQFTLIEPLVDAVNDDNSDGTNGMLVPLAKSGDNRQTLTSFTFELGGLTFTRYKEIIIEGEIRVQGATNFQMLINDIVTDYFQFGENNIGATATPINISNATEFTLADTTVLPSNNSRLYFKVRLSWAGGSRLMGFFEADSHTVGANQGGLANNNSTIFTIDKIIFSVSASTWNIFNVNIYGVKD